ncbi:MAG: hypothetical protein WD768_02810, partial [Phycisphaeraceae bacterium]
PQPPTAPAAPRAPTTSSAISAPAGHAPIAPPCRDGALNLQPVADWLTWNSEINTPSRDRLLAWATTECATDPAYIQSLRLFVKEEQWHADIARKYLALRNLIGRPGGFNRALTRSLIRPLGLRFELSILLLSEIAALAMSRLLLAATQDETLRGLLTQAIHDHECHIAFHSERLTTEFADFNFLRRNLRRLRLRTMFVTLITGLTARHRHLLRAIHCSKLKFARDAWRTFTAVLERMVPYRREELLAILLDQQQKPYEKAGLP